MLEIFKASTENVRELKKNRKKINQLINRSIKNKSKDMIPVLTKTYALTYSAFAETCFLKTIHTPYGFSEDLIKQISSKRNLEKKWNKCIELAFEQIKNMTNLGEIQNKKKRLKNLINEYVIKPSQLRNKIAHGQWKSALNTENTKINLITTKRIKELDFVQVDNLFLIYEKISQVVEDLIESPHKTHFRDFYIHLTELEELVEKTKNWTIETKTKVLIEKFEKQKAYT
ncbi:hypothetical protein [Tenacibaculum finnmarkense]|uniref:hypothetical protein n=1 Tax=Tenacibaculum finnmarkense TaxID=2781243 RepID=UPI0023000D6F|nr:hypothetical protein [Tenacibaculum finnmarkense]WCC46266.1 hypothetical protein PJH08_07620 [Tenacibaculum finnmarkense]